MIISGGGHLSGEHDTQQAGKRRQARIGAPDRSLTPNAGLAVVSELRSRLGLIGALDAAVGPIKQRERGHGAGQLLAGIAAAQLAGEDFLTGLDRQRADAAGQQLTPVPGLSSTTAAGLARRITPGQWRAVEGGLAAVTGRMLARLQAQASSPKNTAGRLPTMLRKSGRQHPAALGVPPRTARTRPALRARRHPEGADPQRSAPGCSCRDEVRRDHRVSGRQGPAMRTRLPTIPHDTASRTLARLHIGPDADHGAWSSRRGHPHT